MNYLGNEIFDLCPIAEGQNSSISNEFTQIGKDYKYQSRFITKPAYREFTYTYHMPTRAKARELRAFFRSKAGRYGTFWLPSHKNDVELIDTVLAGSTSITVKNAKRSFGLNGLNRHIYIQELNYAGKILSVSVEDGTLNGNEVITLSNPLPNITTKVKISYLFYVRFNNDEFKETNLENIASRVNLTFKELQSETV